MPGVPVAVAFGFDRRIAAPQVRTQLTRQYRDSSDVHERFAYEKCITNLQSEPGRPEVWHAQATNQPVQHDACKNHVATWRRSDGIPPGRGPDRFFRANFDVPELGIEQSAQCVGAEEVSRHICRLALVHQEDLRLVSCRQRRRRWRPPCREYSDDTSVVQLDFNGPVESVESVRDSDVRRFHSGVSRLEVGSCVSTRKGYPHGPCSETRRGIRPVSLTHLTSWDAAALR